MTALATLGFTALYALLLILVVIALGFVGVWFTTALRSTANPFDVLTDDTRTERLVCSSCNKAKALVGPVFVAGATVLACSDCAPGQVG